MSRQAREDILVDDGSDALMNQQENAGSSPIRNEIVASWDRCRFDGLAPTSEDVPYRPEFDRSERLLRAATPVIDNLAEQLIDSPSTIMLADAEAQIITRRAGAPTLKRALDKIYAAPGFYYSEESTGTNGIGSAVEERRPFFVQGAEHYRENLVEFTCAGAPITHPITGALEGVLDVTSRVDATNALMKPLVLSAARAIESEIYVGASLNQRTLLEEFLRVSGKTAAGVIALGPGLSMGNKAALDALESSDHALLWDWSSQMRTAQNEHSAKMQLAKGITAQVQATKVVAGHEVVGVVIEIGTDESGLTATDRRTNSTGERHSQALPIQDKLVGRSAASAQLRRELETTSASELPVLVCGEPGTGKLFIAQHLHKRWHRDETCTVLDCRIAQRDPASWIERFASRLDSPGTLVLRHLDALPDKLCSQVLAYLQAGTSQANLVATAHCRGGRQSSARVLDLFPASLTVTPLRYRPEDIFDIAPIIIKQGADRSATTPRIQSRTLNSLTTLEWPGNVRELSTVLNSALIRSNGDEITLADFPPEYRPSKYNLTALERSEHDIIVQTLTEVSGNKMAAANKLGIARSTLYRKMRTLAIKY